MVEEKHEGGQILASPPGKIGLRFHSGYHGVQVTITTRFVAHAYCFRKPGYQL